MYFLQPSHKRLLSNLNPFFVAGFLAFTLLVRTTTKGMLPGFTLAWDILLPFVVYLGQRRTVVEGLVLTLFLSHLYSLASLAPMGVFPIYYLLIFLLARLISYVVYASSVLSIFSLMLLLAVVGRFLLPAVASGFDHGWSVFSWYNLRLSSFPLNALMGLICYVLLDILDKVTYKQPRINIELEGGGL